MVITSPARGLLLRLALIAAMLLSAGAVSAVEPDEVLSDGLLEARARNLSTELRCLVCQNQSIDDSNAPLARDLRLLVRERLVAGDSDTQVRNYVVARYGEFVLLRPPFAWHTLVLWLTPVAVLMAGALFVWHASRGEFAAEGEEGTTLSPEEEAQLQRVLADADRQEERIGSSGGGP